MKRVVCVQYAASASDTATKSFATSGYLSTAHVIMQESPTGKNLSLVRMCIK